MICLHGIGSDKHEWQKAKELLLEEIPNIESFSPTHFWRWDVGVWSVDLFAADANGKVLAITFDVVAKLSYRWSDGCSAGGGVTEGSFNAFVSAQTSKKPNANATLIALLVDRPLDVAAKIFYLRDIRNRIWKNYTPSILLLPEGNLFDVGELLPFAKIAGRQSFDDYLEKDPDTSYSSVMCIFPEQNSDYIWRADFRKTLQKWISDGESKADNANNCVNLFISLELEKRVFVRQEEFFIRLINLINKYYDSINIYVNGMTGSTDGPDSFPSIKDKEMLIIDRIIGSKNISVTHMHGMTIKEKCHAVNKIDYFSGPLGTGTMIPMYGGKVGTTYGSPKFLTGYSWMAEQQTVVVPIEWTTAAEGTPLARPYWAETDDTGESYDIDIEKLLNLCENQIRQLDKNSKRKDTDKLG